MRGLKELVVIIILDILPDKLDFVVTLVSTLFNGLNDRCNRNPSVAQQTSILRTARGRLGITALHESDVWDNFWKPLNDPSVLCHVIAVKDDA